MGLDVGFGYFAKGMPPGRRPPDLDLRFASGNGSTPWRTCFRAAAAVSRASASEKSAKAPNPIHRALPTSIKR